MENYVSSVRILWFANTPGLSEHRDNGKITAGGWISSLQQEIENAPGVELGYVYYNDEQEDAFTLYNTRYYPVRKIGYNKRRRLLNRLAGKTEYEENISRFLQIIDEFQPDIIHIHGTEHSFGLVAKYVRDIPIVFSIQGNLTVYSKKYFSGINLPGLFKQLRAGYPFFTADYIIWNKRAEIEQEILKKAAYIFGRTDWDRRISMILAPQAKYMHIDEIMRENFYQIRWRNPVNPSAVFFTTCSPSLYKGFETILETAKLLVDNNIRFTWQVAGLKEEDAMVRLFKKIKNVNRLADLNIVLMGQLSGEQLADHLLKADIYVQVSHIENSPNSLCEAMLTGIPVISSFAGGTSSLIEDKITGTLIQDGDPYVLAGGLLEILKNPELYKRMADKAYLIAHKRHDSDTITAELLSAYSSILNQGKTGDVPSHTKISINR